MIKETLNLDRDRERQRRTVRESEYTASMGKAMVKTTTGQTIIRFTRLAFMVANLLFVGKRRFIILLIVFVCNSTRATCIGSLEFAFGNLMFQLRSLQKLEKFFTETSKEINCRYSCRCTDGLKNAKQAGNLCFFWLIKVSPRSSTDDLYSLGPGEREIAIPARPRSLSPVKTEEEKPAFESSPAVTTNDSGFAVGDTVRTSSVQRNSSRIGLF